MAKGSGATGRTGNAKGKSVAAAVAKAASTAASVLQAAASIPTKTGAIGLAALRGKLGSMSRAEQDSHLRALHKEGKIALYRNDNTPKVTSADHAAAIDVGGNPRHILYIK